MNREDKRGIFFGVVGVLTLIVAIIGASLAYFSINANSAEDALKVQAATVQIVYEDGDLLEVDEIIPSTKEVALETYRRYLANETYTGDLGEGETQIPYEKCKDDRGYTVCGVYEFSLTNDGINPMDITAKVIPTVAEVPEEPSEGEEIEETVEFRNLKFTLYDITNVSNPATDYGTEVATNTVTYNEFNLMTSPVSLGSKATSNYRLFVWLDEQKGPQDYEQGASFKGTIYVSVSGVENEITGNADQSLGA